MLIQKINNQKGFDLIELMIVICIIIAILTLIAVSMFYSKTANTKTDINITQQEQVVDDKAPSPPKQKETTKQKGEMNKL